MYLEIEAPSVCIRSTSLQSIHAELHGTSMAAPHVTGAVAPFIAASNDASLDAIRNSLRCIASQSPDSP